MARTPRNEVAADKTITARVTDAAKARFERQIEARAADLPERTMTALLMRLLQDSEEMPVPGLAPDVRALLDALVKDRAEELRRLDVDEASATPRSVISRLIRDAAKAKGITAPTVAGAPSPKDEPEEHARPAAPAKAPAARAKTPDASTVHAALLSAIDKGEKQAAIAKRCGIDPGHLSRFRKERSGLSPESLTKLARALEGTT